MKLWTTDKEYFICNHCGNRNEHLPCEECGNNFNFRHRRIIEKYYICLSGTDVFLQKRVHVLPCMLEGHYAYTELCNDFLKYREKERKALKRSYSVLAEMYRVACRGILTTLRTMSPKEKGKR
jgi:hypothetical protein